MSNIKLIAVTVTALSVSTILYISSRRSTKDDVLDHLFSLHANSTAGATRRNLAGGINPQWMGGGLQMGDGPWNEEYDMLQLFSSTPNNPRQYTGPDTEFLHWKFVEEQDAYGATTFPPTESPTQMQMFFAGRPTPMPSEGYGGAWTREPSSRFPTKLPETSFRDDDDRYNDDDDEENTRKPTKKPTKKPKREPTKEPTKEPVSHLLLACFYLGIEVKWICT